MVVVIRMSFSENSLMNMTKTALITHPVCLQHEMGAQHPESPLRLKSVLAYLESSGLRAQMEQIEAPQASIEALAATHAAEYVDHIFATSPLQGYAYLDPDTSMNAWTLDAAQRAAGAVVEGVDRVMSGANSNAFCAVRPCGHHATYAQAMGFCVFNNVAVGARHAINHHGVSRVAILDFDVHHGNGTEDIFRDEPRVMLCSSFQHPYYPGTGANSGSDHIIPTPLTARTGSTAFRHAIEATWLPALERFSPELIIISAGFDAHKDDPLATLELEDDDYVWITERICDIANRHCDGRIVSALEGGYNLDALGRSAVAHVGVLLRQ